MTDDLKNFFIWWLACLLAAACVAGAKIGVFLFRLAPDPPEDPVLAKHWLRRRRWIVWSELSALPAFATIAIAAVHYWHLDPVAGVLIAMFLGGVGFLLMIDAAQGYFRKRLGLEPAAPLGAGMSGGPLGANITLPGDLPEKS